MTITTVISAAPEWVETLASSPPEGFRAFGVVVRLEAGELPENARTLVEVRIRRPYPGQQCQIAYARAEELGFDLATHYAVDAAGNRFLPGMGFAATIGASETSPEADAVREAADLIAPLREWCQALLEVAASDGDIQAIAWPAAPEALAGRKPRHYAEALVAFRRCERETADARIAVDEVALRERNADPVYMPFNWG